MFSPFFSHRAWQNPKGTQVTSCLMSIKYVYVSTYIVNYVIPSGCLWATESIFELKTSGTQTWNIDFLSVFRLFFNAFFCSGKAGILGNVVAQKTLPAQNGQHSLLVTLFRIRWRKFADRNFANSELPEPPPPQKKKQLIVENRFVAS